MDREDFIETLKNQFSNNIREAYLECHHEGHKVELDRLGDLLFKIRKEARNSGLPFSEFDDLVASLIPTEIFDEMKSYEIAA